MTDKIEDLLGNITETNEGIESNLMTMLREQSRSNEYQALHNGKLLAVLDRIANALEGKKPEVELDFSKTESTPEKKTKPKAKKETAPIEKEPVEEVKTALTHADLKAACLAKSRENVANKPKLKALLSNYGASKAVDIPLDKLEEVIGLIEKGEF